MVKRKKIPDSDNEDEKLNEISSVVGENSDSQLQCTDVTTVKDSETIKETSALSSQSADTYRESQKIDVGGSCEANRNLDNLTESSKSTKPIVKQPRKPKKEIISKYQRSSASESAKQRKLSKHRRSWELWSKEDIDNFFDGLFEFGKDFEKIQAFIKERHKKKGVGLAVAKNKEQVRHFYYRTLQKISKYININIEEASNKQGQELCLLVNYRELKKKWSYRLDVKNEQKSNEFSQKLHELIYNGHTYVKFKSRKIKLKTPICRALRILNNYEEPKSDEDKEPKLPSEIKLTFLPKDNKTWAKVQNLSMNPRVKMKIGLQKRLSDVINFLERRWKPYQAKAREKLLKGLPSSTLKNLDLCKTDKKEILKIIPKNVPCSCPITIEQNETPQNNQSITIKDFLNANESLKAKKNWKLLPSNSSETEKTDSSQENMSFETHQNHDESDLNEDKDKDVVCSELEDKDLSENVSESTLDDKSACESEENNFGTLKFEAVKLGFTAKEASSITVGQLYLMLNKPESIKLDYEWTSEKDNNTIPKCGPLPVLRDLIKLASVTFADICKSKQLSASSGTIVSCCCGHVCSAVRSTNKQSNSLKSPVRTSTSVNSTIDSNSNEERNENSVNQIANQKSDPFVKPTHTAPKSQNLGRAIVREHVERLGLDSLKRTGMKARSMRKSFITSRSLLPKSAQVPPVFTVKLMPSGTLTQQITCNGSVVKSSESGASPKKILKILPTGQFIDFSSLNIVKNTVAGSSVEKSNSSQDTSSKSSSLQSSKQTCPQTVTKSTNLISEITASLSDNVASSKGVSKDLNINKKMVNLESVNKRVVKESSSSCSSSSPPRLSIPESNVAKLPSNITAFLNIPSQVGKAAESATEGSSILHSKSHEDFSSSAAEKINVFEEKLNLGSTSTNHFIEKQTIAIENTHPTSPTLSTSWLDTENPEYSLSNLLGSLESPIKSSNSIVAPSSISLMSDNSSLDSIGRLAPDVDTQLQCLMNENSVDYVSKFADLAAHIASSDHKR